MMVHRWRYLAFLLLLLVPLSLFAQSSSSLGGKALDSSGAVLPGVTVTATNTATGLVRTTVTEADGGYRFAALPPGTYRVTAELSGMATAKVDNVVLEVATPRDLDLKLGQASVAEQITVTAEAPLIATSPSVGTVVSQKELENLPLNGRQFANLATLAPGTQLSVNSDPTKPGQLTIALNGGSGRNVNFLIDGGDNTDDTIGGALQNFNLEAVQEFKIQTMQYKAEFGRSTGGVLSVVTKGGTNEMQGSVYGFVRDKSLNQKTPREKDSDSPKSAYKRKQYGGSLGGPIIKDRLHYFATYEKTDRDTAYIVDSGGIFPALDGQLVGLPFEDELFTAKSTWDATAKQFLQVRFGYQKNSDKYGAASVYMPSALGTVSNKYKSLLGSHNYQIGSNKLNEFIYQYTRFDNGITADSNDPFLYFPSGVVSGQNINTPQTTHQEKHQFKDDFSWSSSFGGQRHDFKAGVNYVHEPILGGDFTTGTSGQFSMLEDSATSPVVSIDIFGGFFGDSTPVNQKSIYLQDDWNVSNQLTLNIGGRYDAWTGFDLNQSSNPVWQAYHNSTVQGIPWLTRIQNAGTKLKNDTNNWSPRLGFSYDIAGNAKQIIRGGYGYYYDFPYTNATILFPAAAVQSNYGTIYHFDDPHGIKNPDGSFFHPGQTLPPNQLGNPDVPLPRELASPDIATPYSKQASLGYSWQVNDWLGVNAEFVNIRYKDIPYRFRANPKIDTNGDGTPDRLLFPQFSPRTRVWAGNGFAKYDGLNLGFHARMGAKLEAQGFYTYSKSEGNVLVGADEFRLWDTAVQPGVTRDVSVNPLDPTCSACTGPLFTDARHRLTFSTIYRAPLDINVSGILRYRSALPYTEHAGSDVNGDGYDMDLASGVSHVNSRRGHAFSQFDLRLSRDFNFGGKAGVEVIAEVFNLFNAKNPTSYNGNRSSSAFGQPTRFAGDPGQGEQQLAQLGVRVHF